MWLAAGLLALTLGACGEDNGYSGDGEPANNASNNNGGDNNATNNAGNSANNGDNNAANNSNNSNNADNNSNNSDNNDNNGNNSNVPDTPTIGAGCLADNECTFGEICVGANALGGIEGYCTILNCETSADCEFPRGGNFCCLNYGETRGCFQAADDAVCGDEQGQQNDSCSEGGQSDCDGEGNVYCAEFYDNETALCAQACNPNIPTSCPDDTWCFETQANFGICLPFGDTPDQESCREDPWSCGEDGYCLQNVVDDPYRYCTSLCRENLDCDEGSWCRRFPGQNQGTCSPIGELESGDSCTEDRFGCAEDLFCLNEGTRFATCTALCRRDSDCEQEGSVCNYYDPDNSRGTCTVPGTRGNGESCDDDPFSCELGAFCIGGYQNTYNPDAYCAAECSDDPTVCGEGFFCQEFGEQSFCQPNGPSQPYEMCENALSCAQGTFCRQNFGEENQICVPLCNNNDECAEDFVCSGDAETQGVCLPSGDIAPGESCVDAPSDCAAGSFCAGPDPICISTCTDAPDSCPEGMGCLDANEQGVRYCYPEGDNAAYEGCSGDYECEIGSYCDRRNGEDAGVCLPGCGSDSDCADGYWCFRSNTWNQCLPQGEGQTGDSCADDGFSCDEGNFCLYGQTDQAYCSADCTGFPDACGEGEECRYIGSGVNLCMPTGDRQVGESCADDAQACNDESICIAVGQPGAFCAQICTFDSDNCPEGTTCNFTPGGLGLCAPPDFNPEEPIGGGGPL